MVCLYSFNVTVSMVVINVAIPSGTIKMVIAIAIIGSRANSMFSVLIVKITSMVGDHCCHFLSIDGQYFLCLYLLRLA